MIELTLDGVNLYRIHRIVLETFKIGIPEPQLTTVDVPGRNGKLDMSEALAGHLTYNNRIIELALGIVGSEEVMEQKRLTLFNLINKPLCKLKFSHLQGYFEGRCIVTDVSREHGHYTITMKCDCFPYRYLDSEFSQIRTLSSTLTAISCLCLMMPVVPKIETSSNATIKYKAATFTVQKGVHTLPILFKQGTNELIVSGTGTIKVNYRQGVL